MSFDGRSLLLSTNYGILVNLSTVWDLAEISCWENDVQKQRNVSALCPASFVGLNWNLKYISIFSRLFFQKKSTKVWHVHKWRFPGQTSALSHRHWFFLLAVPLSRIDIAHIVTLLEIILLSKTIIPASGQVRFWTSVMNQFQLSCMQ